MEFSKIGQKIGEKLDKAFVEVEKAFESASETLSEAFNDKEIKNEDVVILLKGKDVIIRGNVDSIIFNDKPYYKKEV